MAVKLNESALTRLLDSENGAVGLDMLRRATNVFNQVQVNAVQNFHIRSGNLLASIAMQPVPTAMGLTVVVGCKRIGGLPDEDQYAVFLEHGTDPHPIFGKSGGWLVSELDNPTPLVRPSRGVDHPGNDPKPFVRPALEAGRL